MDDQCCGAGEPVVALETPTRNRYFYGKLLDAFHFELEQRYFNQKRWLMNRLTAGSGVLCGLKLAPSNDGTLLFIGAGAAIDGWGREIIVPSTFSIEPRQPTDACGEHVGGPVAGGTTVGIWLCYHECDAEPEPVLVGDCCQERRCAPSAVRERFMARVTLELPPAPSGLDDMLCTDLFATPAAATTSAALPATTSAIRDARRAMLCDAFMDCDDAPDDPCVPIATVTFAADGTIAGIEDCAYRPRVYSNAALLEMILCLARHVDECCEKSTPTPTPTPVKALAYVSGDNQAAAAGQPIHDSLVVRVTENGSALGGHAVTFTIDSGGGKIGGTAGGANETGNPVTVSSGADGTTPLPHWRLGTGAAPDRVVASIPQGSPNAVTFTARRVDAPTPPRVLAVWPANGGAAGAGAMSPEALKEWMRGPWFDLTFDREMNSGQLHVESLAAPAQWLRAFVLVQGNSPAAVTVVPVPILLRHMQRVGSAPFVERFRLGAEGFGPLQGKPIVILIKAASGHIIDVTQQLTLDAEFDGFNDFTSPPNAFPRFPVNAARFESLWRVADGAPIPTHLVGDMYAATQSGRTPIVQIPAAGTGDGSEDGRFVSWFLVENIG